MDQFATVELYLHDGHSFQPSNKFKISRAECVTLPPPPLRGYMMDYIYRINTVPVTTERDLTREEPNK